MSAEEGIGVSPETWGEETEKTTCELLEESKGWRKFYAAYRSEKRLRIKHYLDKSVVLRRNQLLAVSYAQEYLWIRFVFRICRDNITEVRFKHVDVCFNLTTKYALTASDTTVTML